MCELDIIFNFEKAYFILDEFLMGGEIQDTSKKSVLKAIEQADLLQEVHMEKIQTVFPYVWGGCINVCVFERVKACPCTSMCSVGEQSNDRKL